MNNIDNEKNKKEMERRRVAELKKKYPGEWLLLADYRTDEVTDVVDGILVWHSKNRATIYTKQLRTKRRLSIEYTGDIPNDLVVIF